MLARSPIAASVALALALAASAVLGLAVAGSGCSHDTDASSALDSGIAPDVEVFDAAPVITVTTLAPVVTTSPAAKVSATWAAYRLDEGDWRPLTPTSEGSYAFPRPAARWSVALVCAASDDSMSTVFVHHRTNTTPSVEVTLEDFCSPPSPPAEFTLTGNLVNVPTTTQWLDFGYARDYRGDAIPASGTTAPYEVVGIVAGTWDLTFGVRDDSFGKLTRVAIRRDETVTADKKIDIDLSGAGSFAPGTKPIALHGMAKGDSITPQILYGAGGIFGIEVGPQDVPADATDATLTYATVPPALQRPSDRYRGTLGAEQDRRYGGRMNTFDVHQAIDLDMTFLPEASAPVVTLIGAAPRVRLETKFPLLASGVRYEVLALAAMNRRARHAWHSTIDAAFVGTAPEVVDTTPDLASLPGWKPAWDLPRDVTANVLATGYESPRPLGDGTSQRSTAKAVEITP